MFGTKTGFSFLELMVVIAIIGLVTTMIIPRLGRKNSAQEREAFVQQLNALVQHASLHARITRALHRVVIDVAKRTMYVEQELTKKDSAEKIQYGPPSHSYANAHLPIPRAYDIKQVIIEGFDEMSRFSGGTTKTIWFYLVPFGIAQSVIINILDRSDSGRSSKGKEIGLVLNPLTVRFKVYDTFQ